MIRAWAVSIGWALATPLAAQTPVPVILEHWVRSDVIGEDYRVQVGLPDGYSTSTDRYGVLVVLDAEKSFGLVRDAADWFAWAGEVEPLIVVGVSYGEDTAAWWAKRARDLTPTLDSVGPYGRWSNSGGAEVFRAFLRNEVMGLIDREYRTTVSRGVVGLSFGGLFGAHDLFAEDRLFDRYLLVSPAWAWDGAVVGDLEARHAARSSRLPAKVYTAIGSSDARNVVEPWEVLDEVLEGRRYEAFDYEGEVFTGESHVSVFPIAVAHGLRFLFGVAR